MSDPDWLVKARSEGAILNETKVNRKVLWEGTHDVAPSAESFTFKAAGQPQTYRLDCPGLVVVSEANQRCHWAVRKKRFADQAEMLLYCLAVTRMGTQPKPRPPMTITMTRLGGKGLDSDNLAGAFKAVRDTLCRWLSLDDGDKRLRFLYKQKPGKMEPGIRIDIRERRK